MRLPQPLSRNKKNVHKNTFGHVLVIGGSAQMLGAGCLTALAALRSGAGLVTLAVPKNLIIAAQEKCSNCVMVQDRRSLTKKVLSTYSAVAIGPGLGRTPTMIKHIHKYIATIEAPLVIDADALFAVSKKLSVLTKTKTEKVLTPHPGEMSRLTKKKKGVIEKARSKTAKDFADKYKCTLLLKGHRTVVATHGKRTYTNKTGNPGMATAGSGDVLTGMIAAFLAQGLSGHDAAKYGAHLHGKAGDLAAKDKTKTTLIASDLIDHISQAIKQS